MSLNALHKPILIGLAAATVTACSQQAQDEVARETARSAIAPVIQNKFPGVPVQPAVDCIIDNATAQQIRALAVDAVAGPTASTVETVTQIVSKPETLTCLTDVGLPALLR